MILLTDEEMRELVYSLGKHLKSKDIAKAQLKKVLEYLDKRSFSFQPDGESAVWVISCDKQALLKEVE